MVPIGVLVSGRGSNLEAVLKAIEQGNVKNAKVRVVISNRPEVPAFQIARTHNIPTVALDDTGTPKKSWDYDKAVIAALEAHHVTPKVGLLLLAGYFRILSKEFVELYKHRIMNVHPSLLPAFSGLNAQKQALDYGVKIAGCTVHFVDVGVDTGPIILQAATPVLEDDTLETLSARILREEHKIYPDAVRLFVEGRLKISGRKVITEA
jgi:phosphoribosylglycinamide formyltransferase-1